jgi:K(+)-stimulated pyrophosphate-energized sodium pump
MSDIFILVPLASILALVFAWFFFKSLMKNSEGTDRMKEIAQYVREGAMAYLKRQYKVVGIVFVILVILLTIMAYFGVQNPFVPIAFLTGGFFSGLCGFLGMKTATHASARTAHGASQSLNKRTADCLPQRSCYGIGCCRFCPARHCCLVLDFK